MPLSYPSSFSPFPRQGKRSSGLLQPGARPPVSPMGGGASSFNFGPSAGNRSIGGGSIPMLGRPGVIGGGGGAPGVRTPTAYDPLGGPAGKEDETTGLRGTLKQSERVGKYFLGPDAIAGTTQALYDMMASSPAFAQMLRGIQQSASQASTGAQSALGRTGLSSSGVGAVTGGMAKSLGAQGSGQARGQLFNEAMQTALQSLLARFQGLTDSAGHIAGRTSEGFKPLKSLWNAGTQVATARAGRPG